MGVNVADENKLFPIQGIGELNDHWHPKLQICIPMR